LGGLGLAENYWGLGKSEWRGLNNSGNFMILNIVGLLDLSFLFSFPGSHKR
jgi:hypothetical protein